MLPSEAETGEHSRTGDIKYKMRNESGTETRTPSTCPGQHLLSLLAEGTHMAFRFCG